MYSPAPITTTLFVALDEAMIRESSGVGPVRSYLLTRCLLRDIKHSWERAYHDDSMDLIWNVRKGVVRLPVMRYVSSHPCMTSVQPENVLLPVTRMSRHKSTGRKVVYCRIYA